MQHTASHSILCNARRDRVFELIRRSVDWPQVFEPCLSVNVLETALNFERIEVSARVGGLAMSWESSRRFIPEVCGIDSTLIRPMKLVRAMTASWRVLHVNAEQCLLLLEHAYDLETEIAGQVEGVESAADAQRFIEAAIDANSRTELGNIKAAVEVEREFAAPVALDQHSSFSVVCEAPADSVYAVVRDTSLWPRIFDACLSATRLEGEAAQETVRIEALQEGRRVAWNTQRTYFDAIRRIDYYLPVPMPFLAAMRGQWRVVPLGAQRCLLTVDRHWRLLDDVRGVREGVETVAEASAIFDAFVNDNARAEMQAISHYVKGDREPCIAFTNTHDLPFPPGAVYEVLANIAAWPDVLPHCEAIEVMYDDTSYQEFSMRVRTPRGSESFRSIRRCDADGLTITYFQPNPPAVLRSHQGSWQVRSHGGGTRITTRHSVQLDAGECAASFGDTDPRLHKERVKSLLTTNSGATVAACVAWLKRVHDAEAGRHEVAP